MTGSPEILVADVRLASRDLVRQFGFMNRTLAGTDLSASGVHAIIEIGNGDGLSAKALGDRLLLEKSTISRLVKSLIARGDIDETRSAGDGRVKNLRLTPRGRETLAGINRFAVTQVSDALALVDERSRTGIAKGLRDYADALKASAAGENAIGNRSGADVVTGYAPGHIGWLSAMLLKHMSTYFGFGIAFERRIATDMVEFFGRLDAPENETWRAVRQNRMLGGITIDGEHLGDNLAHLRWFVVDESVRGQGAGNALLTNALDFCDRRGYRETHLWTVKGLDAARALYERHGFHLAKEFTGDQWGKEVAEQKFVRPLGG